MLTHTPTLEQVIVIGYDVFEPLSGINLNLIALRNYTFYLYIHARLGRSL